MATREDKDKDKNKKSAKPKGGQNGHKGTNLKKTDNPDKVKNLKIDKRTLPKDRTYKSDGYVARQIFDIKISRIVTEYRAEILIDDLGNKYTASFPDNITRPAQYGSSIKAHAVYLSTYQLQPYDRIQEQFNNEYNIPISKGSVCNFNAEGANLLDDFEKIVKHELASAAVAHADETGINLNGTRKWLHGLSNDKWTWLEPHEKRGTIAMNDIGIIPLFKGVLCHDHWKPYYTYTSCLHSLCNAHHIRELTRAYEQDEQNWAKLLMELLLDINKAIDCSEDGILPEKKSKSFKKQYRKILKDADIECPSPKQEPNKTARIKRSKARNLLEKLSKFEDDVLRFMDNKFVPFTNNQGERDLRMIKVQQKISGCFRTLNGAMNFCKIRSYLSTCKKNDVSASEALELLFNGKFPKFIQDKINSS